MIKSDDVAELFAGIDVSDGLKRRLLTVLMNLDDEKFDKLLRIAEFMTPGEPESMTEAKSRTNQNALRFFSEL